MRYINSRFTYLLTYLLSTPKSVTQLAQFEIPELQALLRKKDTKFCNLRAQAVSNI